jgi:hypothetical protein
MDTSGKPYEGWMTVIPVSVFLLVVIVALGGPVAFVNTLSLWVSDLLTAVVSWVRNL